MDWLYWQNDEWTTEEKPILSLKDNAFWMGNTVFDGARAFNGWMPDLDRHCARAIESAKNMLLEPPIDLDTLIGLCREGVKRFPKDAELYIRPMFFPTGGFVVPEPDTTKCAIAIHRLTLPDESGFTACITPFRRPHTDMAPTNAKAACLYPNMQRAIVYARERGHTNAIIHKTDGTIAEFASANLMIVKDGEIFTASGDGTFLTGITRRRVMELLAAEGTPVKEISLTEADLMSADEVFSTGNYAKVLATTKIDDKTFGSGPVTKRVREMYWDYSQTCPI